MITFLWISRCGIQYLFMEEEDDIVSSDPFEQEDLGRYRLQQRVRRLHASTACSVRENNKGCM